MTAKKVVEAIVDEPAMSDVAPPLGIAMLSNLFHPIASGSATQTLGLSRALVTLGHRVVVITAHVDPSSPEHEIIDGVDVYRLPSIHLPKMSISLHFPWLNWTFWPANLRRIEEILRRHDINLLHVHNHMFDMAFVGMAMKRRLGLPIVLTLHTIIKHSVRLFNLLLYPADRGFLKHAVVRRADAVICPDVNIQAYLAEAFDRHDGRLIPYGISLPPHPGRQVEEDIISRFGLNGRRVILSLGHVHALRNRLDLIRAMPKVRERFPEVLLLIVGDVADQRPVELVAELGLKETVIFAGAQPYAHIPVYHELAEFEAMWLDQAEAGLNSLGVACMEAMLAGKPVLSVSNVDTFGPGVLRSGRDVVIVKAGDAAGLTQTIVNLLDDPQATARIGYTARTLAEERFAWPEVAAQTEGVYRSLVPAEKLADVATG